MKGRTAMTLLCITGAVLSRQYQTKSCLLSLKMRCILVQNINEPSAKTAVSWGCRQVDEFRDEVNEITKVFMISREEWEKLRRG